MRITFISPTVNMGGGIRVIAIYARALIRLGHQVRVVSPPRRRIPRTEKLKSWAKGNGWPDDHGQPSSHFQGGEVEQCVLDRWRPVTDTDVPDGDVVIATWWETAHWVAKLNSGKGAKVYFIQHHEIFDYLPVAQAQATYRLPLHKIVIAQWLKRVMSEQYGDDCVDLVPNSVDRRQFFASPRGKQVRPTVGFLYSSVHFKGLDTLRAALQLTRKRFPNLRLISFGSQQPSSAMPLPEHTEFFYLPPQDEIRNLYARCDAWATASRSEGFNLPALEAMACRTPVVSTRTGWPEEAIKSGWNGVLVEIDDVTGLAKGIEWVLSQSDEQWKMLSDNASATASVGSWDESARMFERALEHARRRLMSGELASAF